MYLTYDDHGSNQRLYATKKEDISKFYEAAAPPSLSLINAYAGDTIAVVGTQNRNGYTSFRDMTMDEYMDREHSEDGWKKIVQIPLPSFAGKDEALFVLPRSCGEMMKENVSYI